jgi:hypothetical protein
MIHAQSLLTDSNNPLEEAAASSFAKYVMKALEEKGWTVKAGIGASNLKIDIGVVHPDDPNKFLAGIECDGESYRKTPTAVDRNILRKKALEGLGWKIIRVWAPDWYRYPEHPTNRLHEELLALKAGE